MSVGLLLTKIHAVKKDPEQPAEQATSFGSPLIYRRRSFGKGPASIGFLRLLSGFLHYYVVANKMSWFTMHHAPSTTLIQWIKKI